MEELYDFIRGIGDFVVTLDEPNERVTFHETPEGPLVTVTTDGTMYVVEVGGVEVTGTFGADDEDACPEVLGIARGLLANGV